MPVTGLAAPRSGPGMASPGLQRTSGGWEDGAGVPSAQESREGKRLEELCCACMCTGITSASDAAGIASRILSLGAFVICLEPCQEFAFAR